MKNLCAKTRPASNPYEIWRTPDGSWEWRILKKWQADDYAPMARAFCLVTSPYTYGTSGDLGDVYMHEIRAHARRVEQAS